MFSDAHPSVCKVIVVSLFLFPYHSYLFVQSYLLFFALPPLFPLLPVAGFTVTAGPSLPTPACAPCTSPVSAGAGGMVAAVGIVNFFAMNCLLIKLMASIIIHPGIDPKPHMAYPTGIRRSYCAKSPSIGCHAPEYSTASRYLDFVDVGRLLMSELWAVVKLRVKMCSGLGPVGTFGSEDLRGIRKW